MSGLVRGEYAARGVTAQLGLTGTGKEQVAVELEIAEGNYQGQRITWFGFFTEQTTDRTLESLRLLGWEGDDLSDLHGIDKNLVRIVCEEETYQGTTRVKVRWINGPGGMALKDPLTVDQARAFAARMKGAVVAHRQKAGTPATRPTDDDIPF